MSRSAMRLYRMVEIGFAVALLAAIVVLVALAALARASGSPIIWSVEVAQLLFAWLCVLAADIALQQDRHFGLSILGEAMSPRARRLLDLFNLAVLCAFLAFLLVYAWRNAVLMYPRRFGATQMSGTYVHASLALGSALLLRTMLAKLIARLRDKESGACS